MHRVEKSVAMGGEEVWQLVEKRRGNGWRRDVAMGREEVWQLVEKRCGNGRRRGVAMGGDKRLHYMTIMALGHCSTTHLIVEREKVNTYSFLPCEVVCAVVAVLKEGLLQQTNTSELIADLPLPSHSTSSYYTFRNAKWVNIMIGTTFEFQSSVSHHLHG